MRSDHTDPVSYTHLDVYKRQQYAVAAATQAYEDSGMTAESIAPDRFGVYIGSGIGGIHTLIAEHTKLIEKGPGRVSPFFVPMMISNLSLIHI